MATRKSIAPSRPNGKIRFIMLEADISEEGLSDLANAITTALRPAPARRLLTPTHTSELLDSTHEEAVDDDEPTESDDSTAQSEATAKVSKPRKYPTPKVIDVDLDSGKSFRDFAAEKGPTETTKRYLTVAAWFKEQRGLDEITADHVYTCFKKAGWSTSIKEFGQPLRDLAKRGWGTTNKSVFKINHLGLDVVQTMTPG